MKKLAVICGGLLAVVLSVPVLAQDQNTRRAPVVPADELPAPDETKLSPDLLRHLQEMERYQSPHNLARQAAVEKAQQRRARIAAAKWYGYSPLRPNVSSIPAMGNYLPIWNTDVTRPTQWYHVRAYDVQ